MDITEALREASEHLVQTQALRRSGMSEREITRASRSGALARLRPGWYARGSFWDDALPEARHLAALLAAQRAAASQPLFSHLSAAALLDFPAWAAWLRPPQRFPSQPDPRTVHVTPARREQASSSAALIRHRTAIDASDVTSIAGLRCTSPERTVSDLARSEPFEVALSSADARLRDLARVGRSVDAAAVSSWREDIRGRAVRQGRQPGNRAVRAVAALADPLADSPLESVSRMRFAQLGIRARQQVRVPARGRGSHYLDFVLEGLGIWGEADGKHKYLDSGLRGGRSAEEVVYAEKQRTEWITGTTGLRAVRWGVAQVVTVSKFAAHLRAHGVPFPGSPDESLDPQVRDFLRTLP